MFAKEIDNKDTLWRFRLISEVNYLGKVIDYLKDANGCPIMIKIDAGRHGVWDIPWTSIVAIQKFGYYSQD